MGRGPEDQPPNGIPSTPSDWEWKVVDPSTGEKAFVLRNKGPYVDKTCIVDLRRGTVEHLEEFTQSGQSRTRFEQYGEDLESLEEVAYYFTPYDREGLPPVEVAQYDNEGRMSVAMKLPHRQLLRNVQAVYGVFGELEKFGVYVDTPLPDDSELLSLPSDERQQVLLRRKVSANVRDLAHFYDHYGVRALLDNADPLLDDEEVAEEEKDELEAYENSLLGSLPPKDQNRIIENLYAIAQRVVTRGVDDEMEQKDRDILIDYIHSHAIGMLPQDLGTCTIREQASLENLSVTRAIADLLDTNILRMQQAGNYTVFIVMPQSPDSAFRITTSHENGGLTPEPPFYTQLRTFKASDISEGLQSGKFYQFGTDMYSFFIDEDDKVHFTIVDLMGDGSQIETVFPCEVDAERVSREIHDKRIRHFIEAPHIMHMNVTKV